MRPDLVLALAVSLGLSVCAAAWLYAEAAADVPDTVVEVQVAEDPVGAADALYNAIRAGRWLPAIGAAAMLLIWGVRRLGAARLPWLCSRAGGRTLAGVTAALLVVVPSLLADRPPSLGLVAGALAAGWVAAGQWDDVKDARQARARRRAKTDPGPPPIVTPPPEIG